MTHHEPPPPTAAEYFGAMAAGYDSLIRRAVPRYAEMTERLLAYLPDAPARVLELGCGTGNLTLKIAARYPSAAISFVDAAPEMTSLTRERLAAEHPGRDFQVVTARFEDLVFPAASFDLVTSTISLHHVKDKASLYRKIRAWLAPGGTFRFADQLRGGTERNHAINWGKWLEFCREKGNCTEAETQSLVDHAAAHDHYTPLAEHFELLIAAGFERRTLDCVWRNWIWGVVTAEAAAG